MATQDINIKINLQGIQKFSSDIKQAGTNLKQLGREIGTLSRESIIAGTAITAPLAIAFKSAEKYSLTVRKELERLDNVFIRLRVSIAENMLPAVQGFTNALARITNIWNDLNPKMQQAIINNALLAGGILIVVGVMGSFVANLLKITGVLASLASKMAILTGVTLPQFTFALLAIVGVIYILEKSGIKVANVLEIAFKSIALIQVSVFTGLVKTADLSLSIIEKVLNAVAQLPSLLGGLSKEAVKGISSVRKELDLLGKAGVQTQNSLASGIGKAFKGDGSLQAWIDESLAKINNFKEGLTSSIDIPKFQEKVDELKSMTEKTAQAMSSSFSNFFFKVFTRESVKLKDVFADFGRSVMQIISDVIARIIITKTLGAKNPAFDLFSFHSGGIVKKAHSGALARDEVPIIAQSGEGIISRKGMRSLGEQGFNSINSGEGSGGGGSQPILIIKAWDFTDIYKNRKAIEGIMENAMATNTNVRKTSMRYS